MANWETKMVETERGTFEVFVKGQGEPLCVTHLYSQFNATGDYFAERFTSSHQVFLVNIKDCGNSEKAKDESEWSLVETVKDLEAVREALGFAKWHFAGHSTGGMLGVVYGIYFSDILSSLIIVGAAASKYAQANDCLYNREHPLYARCQEIIEILKRTDVPVEERRKLNRERTSWSLYHPENMDLYFDNSCNKLMAGHRLHYFSANEYVNFDLTMQLPNIKTPTLILCGEHDVQCPARYSVEMHELIPGSELVLFPESNHYPFMEEKEAFDAAVARFFTGLNKWSNTKALSAAPAPLS